MKQNQKGFTLVEMAVAVGLMLIISAIALPSLSRSIANYRLKATARTLYSHFQQARLEAAKRNTGVVILLTSGTGSAGGYRLFADDGSGGGTAGNEIQDGSEPAVLAPHAMPDDITLVNISFSNSRSGYTARGFSMTGNGSLTLSNIGLDSYSLTMSNTGLVTLTKTN